VSAVAALFDFLLVCRVVIDVLKHLSNVEGLLGHGDVRLSVNQVVVDLLHDAVFSNDVGDSPI
jgi:hypothetical protein